MKWKDEYAIGIPELDNQHKTLIEFLTDFEQACEGKAHRNTVHPPIGCFAMAETTSEAGEHSWAPALMLRQVPRSA